MPALPAVGGACKGSCQDVGGSDTDEPLEPQSAACVLPCLQWCLHVDVSVLGGTASGLKRGITVAIRGGCSFMQLEIKLETARITLED